jgi:hypothetical protein
MRGKHSTEPRTEKRRSHQLHHGVAILVHVAETVPIYLDLKGPRTLMQEVQHLVADTVRVSVVFTMDVSSRHCVNGTVCSQARH